MGKFLILKFKNAGFFTNPKTKDFVWIDNKRVKRETQLRFQEPITKYQISNLLHVIFGERPVPSFRKVSYKPEKHYQTMADNSYLNIESYMKPEIGKMKAKYPTEAFTVRKAATDSWNKQITMSWSKIKLLLCVEDSDNPDELYDQFIKRLKQVFKFKSIDDITFDEIKLKILKLKSENIGLYKKFIVPLFQWLEEKKKKPIENYILHNLPDMNKNSRTLSMVNKGVDSITRISGTILVPVEDSDIEKLKNLSGWATLLDGGFVKIDNVVDDNMISPEGFTKVANISVKKIPVNSYANENKN